MDMSSIHESLTLEESHELMKQLQQLKELSVMYCTVAVSCALAICLYWHMV